MNRGASAAVWHGRTGRINSRGVVLFATLGLLAALIAVAPLKWTLVLLGGGVLGALVCIRPAIGLVAVGLAIPFGGLFKLPGGANWVDALVALTFASWLARGVSERHIQFRRPPLTWALLVFVWCLALSLTQATSWREGLPEWLKWAEFAAIYLLATQILDEKNAWWALGGLFAAGLAQVALGGYQFLRQVGPAAFILQGRFMRAYGTFQQPNPYAGYLGCLAPVAASLALGAIGQWWIHRRRSDLVKGLISGGVSVALIVGIFMSWSRGSWLGLTAGLLGVVGLRSRRTAAVVLVGMILLTLTVTLAGTDWIPGPIGARLSDLRNDLIGPDPARVEITDANFSVLERLAHWEAGRRMFSDHPWLGVGIGNFGTTYAAYAQPHWYESLGHAHNIFVNFLAETGVIGFVAFAFLWLAAGWQAWKITGRCNAYRGALAIGVLGTWLYLSVHSMFDNLFVAHTQLQLALLLGALVAAGNASRLEDRPQRSIGLSR